MATRRKLTWPQTNAGARVGVESKRVREHVPSASQSMADARLMECKWGLKCSQGTACQPILFSSNWSTQKDAILPSFFQLDGPKGGAFLCQKGPFPYFAQSRTIC